MTIHAAVGDYATPLDAWLGRLNIRYDMLTPAQRRKANRILGDRPAERSESYALALSTAIREARGNRGKHARYVARDKLQFPWLSDTLQDAAITARYYGLAISHFNSGSRHNANNGTRFFYSPDDDNVDHFRGDHLTHCRTMAEVYAFLDGYKAGRATSFGMQDGLTEFRVRVSENQSSHDPYEFEGTFRAATEEDARKMALAAAQANWGWSDEQRDMMFVASIGTAE